MKTVEMTRGYNFGSGPAMLPVPVLEKISQACLNWKKTGMSILEIGHRHPLFLALMEELNLRLRRLLHISEAYDVLWLTAPARLQFSMIPMNFLPASSSKAAYVISGFWSEQAYQEAHRLASVYPIRLEAPSLGKAWPMLDSTMLRSETSYVYYTANETIDGIRFESPPFLQTGLPMMVDMTSSFLTEPLHMENFACVFSGIQKNIGPAGLTVVVVKKSLLASVPEGLPSMMDYRVHANLHSLAATPAVFQCYAADQMLKWIEQSGGVSVMFEKNKAKAQRVYDYLDRSSFYVCDVASSARSYVNICFRTPSAYYDALFIEEAAACGLYALGGHRQKGGLRAGLYNAMPMEGVVALIEFMEIFRERYREC